MLITRHLKGPCPQCGLEGNHGNINIFDNVLYGGCNNCKKRTMYPLPDIRKKIIYLDQFFLSHAFRKNEKLFSDAAKRIKDLAARQLLVCPYSSVHTDETHLWRHEHKEDLYNFIKQTARGYKFTQATEIKKHQMHRAFKAFINKSSQIIHLEEKDAFRDNIHKWDDYFWIDVGPFLGDLEAIRKSKSDSIDMLIELFPTWANLESTFDEDVASEAFGYGKSLIEQYLRMIEKIQNGDSLAYMNAPVDVIYVESLLFFDKGTIDINQRIQRIAAFFSSSYFINIPNIRISCSLFAVLRKMVKHGAYKNKKNAKSKLGGLAYDSEFISVFGPYCDGIFIDRSMKRWCEDHEAKVFSSHKTKVFSAENWDDFHLYLDDIEKNYTSDIREALGRIYPNSYN